jgi:hypothetical protein
VKNVTSELNELNKDVYANFVYNWNAVEDHVAGREAISFADRMGANYNVGERIALVHSEVSEALEGIRQGDKPDKHLPHRPEGEVELADAVIRIMGIAKVRGYNLASAIVEKALYNDVRADHKAKNRSKANGKQF